MTTHADTPSTDGAGSLVVGIVIVSMVARIGGLTTTRYRNHPRGTHP
ncbi:hypothetical protein [Williamsia sp. CHRR-6]|nr:hypothetical protein [Williamsia sp. CHRR-6]MBT0568603.1 hypothetical protein [Williamsia sp. CHRR-6]